ncbi:MAG: permease [Candidatus Latescibacterota bacterium]|nr:permease [Candidatus Latescibacterota bacterium]
MDLSPSLLFCLSLLALSIGPFAYAAARLAQPLMAALDGLIFVVMGGLVIFHVLPEALELAGWIAVVGVGAGLWLPTFIEHRIRSMARQVHNVTLVFGLIAIAVHAFTDGLALAPAPMDIAERHMLPMAVLLHRLPVGLTVWFLLRPLYGLVPASGVLVLMGLATTAGFLGGGSILGTMESSAWGLFQSIIAGSLLHVVVHRSYPVHGLDVGSVRRWHAGAGAIAGLGLLWLIGDGHSNREGTEAFLMLALKSGPALLLAYLAAGLVYGLLPRGTIAWMGRGTRMSQALRGVGFGLPLPICSCGVIPVYRSLVTAGVPATAAMSFLIATPELSLDAVLISLPLLGGEMTLVRVAGAVLVAIAIGWIVGRFTDSAPVPAEATAKLVRPPLSARLRTGLSVGLGEVVDTTAPWILVGLALVAAAHSLLGDQLSEIVPQALEVEVFALLGMPAYVCASGSTPLAAVMIFHGASPGAALAFLITGPATNVTTIGVLSRLHGRRVALLFSGSVVALAVILGRLVNSFVDISRSVPDLGAEHDQHSALEGISLALLAALFLVSLLRQGPRGFVGELFEAGDEDGHSHEYTQADEDDCGGEGCSSDCAEVGVATADRMPQETAQPHGRPNT